MVTERNERIELMSSRVKNIVKEIKYIFGILLKIKETRPGHTLAEKT